MLVLYFAIFLAPSHGLPQLHPYLSFPQNFVGGPYPFLASKFVISLLA